MGASIGSVRVLAVVVGLMFCGVGYHTTGKRVELSYDLDCTISFWSWILSWKCPHLMEISTFRGYYPHFVDIIRILWILYALATL